jgi:hypothetical protein
MSKLICETCGQYEHQGECDMPNQAQVSAPEVEYGKLQERIKELEELMPTNGEIRLIKTALENESMRRYGNVKKDAPIFIRLAKLQAIIEGNR